MLYNNVKPFLEEENYAEAAVILSDLYISKPSSFRKRILLMNILPEPMSRNYEKRQYLLDRFKEACTKAEGLISQTEYNVNEFIYEYNNLIKTIEDFYHLYNSNNSLLNNSNFGKRTMEEHFRTMCVFIEDQSRLLWDHQRQHGKTAKTGYEDSLATVEGLSSAYSPREARELLIENAQTIFRLLHYKYRKDKSSCNDINNWLPYKDSDFEIIVRLAEHKNFLDILWARYKYRNWINEERKDDVGDSYNLIYPSNLKYFKKEKASIFRYQIKGIAETYSRLSLSKKAQEAICILGKIARTVDIKNFNTIYRLNKKDYKKLKLFTHEVLKNEYKDLAETLLSNYNELKIGINKELSIGNFIHVIEYMLIIAKLFDTSLINKGNFDQEENIKLQAPIIIKDDLIRHFCKLHEIEYSCAEKYFELLIFNSKSQSQLDLFSQPLVDIGGSRLIFCPTIVQILSVNRIINQQLRLWKTDIAHKGKEFEEKIKLYIKKHTNFYIAEEKIEFDACDGKAVEFDLFGYLDGYVVLIEMKCVTRPYEDKEYFEVENTIKEAIDQLKRRVNIVMKDWETIRDISGMKLPPTPPAANKIIKIVCLNVFGFTGIEMDDVFITDYSALTRFFRNSAVNMIVQNGENRHIRNVANLWSGTNPSIIDLIQYLKNPYGIALIETGLQPEWRSIFKLSNSDKSFHVFDFILEEDPLNMLMKEMEIS